ncbi:MAG: alpha/beta fold hydrolase [Geothrix sp.]|nr:alpha/beta fold hydrolase [Geothrix sp.]MDP1832112.1 alpha/beta fold hydrolase [Geothrix sp.]
MRARVNGIEVAYTDEGKGSPLLFVHGFPLSRGTWEKQVMAFRPDHRVIAPDLRGLGESGVRAGSVSMNQYADDLFALMQHLDDTIMPISESEALARAIPAAQLKLIPKAGHLVAFECSEAFNGILKAWLD